MRNFHPGKRRSQGLGLQSLTDDELDDIHLATLEVLEKTGLFVETAEAMDVFEGAGAEVDRDNKIVKIPPYLVEDAIRSAPSKIMLAGRDPNHDKVLEAGRVHFTNFSEGIKVIDPFTGERRSPVKADLANAAKLIDCLDHIDVCEKAVGPSKDFLGEKHTLEHMQIHSQPEFLDRNRMEKWQAMGAVDSYTKAAEKARYILQNHKPEPLPDKVVRDIQSIITETEKELGI